MGLRGLSAWSIRNPIIPIVLFMGLFLAGLVSFLRMGVTNNPDIEFPTVQVLVGQPGASPTEIEVQITQPLEAAVSTINGVKSIQSTASEGNSLTLIEFEIGTDVVEALNEVETAVDGVRARLPNGILEPRVSKIDAVGGPIGYFAIEASDTTIAELSWFVDDTVRKRLLDLQGVATVERGGGVDREIEVILDLASMQALGVTASQINRLLRQDNLNAAGGFSEIGGTRQSVRVLGNAVTAFDLSRRRLALDGGRSIQLADVAMVRDGVSERTTIAEIANKEVVIFSISRTRGDSDLSVYQAVVEELAAIEAETKGLRFIPLGTSTDYTRSQYSSSISALFEGAVLAVVVVFLFLRDWRATLISAVAIPLSAIPTFFFMDLLGFNLNSLSLLALALVAGVLVDDAIVEIENIVRHIRMGKSPYQASIDAADEIGLPVVATSFCIVAVFLPVGLMPGISGRFFKNFGLTVVVAVLMSLAVARMITPLMAAYFLSARDPGEHGGGRTMDLYLKVLAWTLDAGQVGALRAEVRPPRRRWLYALCLLTFIAGLMVATSAAMFASFGALSQLVPTRPSGAPSPGSSGAWFDTLALTGYDVVKLGLVIAIGFAAGWLLFRLVGFFAGTRSAFAQGTQYLWARFHDHRLWMLGAGWISLIVSILLFSQVPGQFQPTINTNQSAVEIELVPGSTLASTKRAVDQVVAIISARRETDFTVEIIREGSATLYVNLVPAAERHLTSTEIERELAPVLGAIPDLRVRFASQSAGFGSGRDITIMLAGSDHDLLNDSAAKLVEQMRTLPSLVAPRVSADTRRPEIVVTLRRQIAAQLGVSTASLAQTIRIATLGEIEQDAARFSFSDRQIPIMVRLPEGARRDLNTIRNLPVPIAGGGTVPLSRVADIGFGSGPAAIQRYNQNRRVLVGADLAQGIVAGTAQAEINRLPILQALPRGVFRDAVGDEELQIELQENLTTAILAGVLLVFAVLVLLYKRLMSPLVNMTSLALAPLGGILLIWLIGMAQSMPVYIGILLLLGIVSKNSILLIDFAIEEMDRGASKRAAIMEAGQKRAQPIVMTTVAMTAGMIPVALSVTGDGAWRQPMGVVVIGGLVMSTLLTLVIVPAGFSLADSLERRLGPWLRRNLTNQEQEARPA